MICKSNGKGKLFSVPILYGLFGTYMLGAASGVLLLLQFGRELSVSSYEQNISHNLLHCILYYFVLLLFSRTSMGIVLIPALVLFRAFVYGIAISVLIRNCTPDFVGIFAISAPAVIQLTGLLYLATLCTALSLRRLKNGAVLRENINEARRGILAAILCAVLGAAVEMILN